MVATQWFRHFRLNLQNLVRMIQLQANGVGG